MSSCIGCLRAPDFSAVDGTGIVKGGAPVRSIGLHLNNNIIYQR